MKKRAAPKKARQSLRTARQRSAEHQVEAIRDRLIAAQTELHESKQCAVVVILTGVPTAGRSEAVNTLLEWVDPKHVSVHALDRDDPALIERPALWPYWVRVPERGRIAIFFDGWYEQPFREGLRRPKKARQHEARVAECIRRFETLLIRERVRILKAHFTVDEATQRRRLKELASDPLTASRVTKHDRWLAKHHDRVHAEWRRLHALTDQPHARWHQLNHDGHKARAAELGRLLLATIESPQPVTEIEPPRTDVAVDAPTLPSAPTPACSDAQYDRELPELQTRFALLTRKKKFAKCGLVLAFEGMDAAGKGGAIRRITQALDARHYRVVPVSAPSPEELLHPYLWRFWRETVRRGRIAIFDRSWYGRVLIERVRDLTPEADWQRAYDEIREFELELCETGFVIKKFWLAVSEAEQLARLKTRENDPLKRFKVDPQDWANRKYFKEYETAAGEMLARTHSPHAPWVVVPADDKKAARLKLLGEVVRSLEER